VPEALAGWLVPGLGHYLIGERQRGGILAVTIITLYVAGLLIGGVSVCDRREHRLWFLGQVLVAPSVLVDRYHQHLKGVQATLAEDEPPAFVPSFGRVHEQGVLYTALAGLLNLLAILDLIYRQPGEEVRRAEDAELPRPGTGGVP
jgi:hypothetical protein